MSARTLPMLRRLAVTTALGVAAALFVASPSSAADGTAYGNVVKPQGGESYPQALARSESRYGGKLGVIRYFDSNAPDAWNLLRPKLTDHDAIISFRISPATVLSGSADFQLRNWFRTAPTDTLTYWSYMHEPEDDITSTSGMMQYRQAWARISRIEREVEQETLNTNLRSTLILMCYTVNPASGRNWTNYYSPGAIDILGWDCYNHGEKRGVYGNPTNLYSRAITVSRNAGIPWGMAEFGSRLATGDSTGSGRAAWLTTVSRYFYNEGALFASYFDTNGAGSDYRLLDEPSRQAWFNVISDQMP